ncbi:MAG: PKD domain-containing protein [Bacteroidota bacterium]
MKIILNIKKTYSFAIVCCLFINAAAQQVTFQISYDVGMMDLFGNVRQTSDDGYIITGTDIDIFGTSAVLIKTDTAGTVTWAKSYGGFFAYYTANDVKQTSDGGYIITGSLGSELILIKTDASGTIQWSRDYGGGDEEYGYAVKQTSDGGYIVAGSTYSFSAKDSSNFYLLKTNSTGTMTWDRAFQISNVDDESGQDVIEVSDGYIIVGSTPQVFGPDTTTDAVIIKTDLSGNLSWAKTYGDDADSEEAMSLQKISTNELLVTGWTDANVGGLDAGDVFLMRTDGSGNINWSTSYDMGLADEPSSVQETSDNGYAAFGFTIDNLFPLTIETFLLKTNSAGTIQISQHYSAGIGAILGRGQQTSDGGYILGSMQGNMTSWDFQLYKTDDAGITTCNESTYGATQPGYSPAVAVPAVTTFSGGSDGNINPSTSTFTPVTNVFCLTAPCVPLYTVPTSGNDASCFGDCDGDATVTPSGGISPYTYLWDDPASQSTATATGLCAGTYNVTVTDDEGCVNSNSYVVNQPATLSSSTTGNDASCFGGCDGDATVAPSGGTSPYTYLWDDPGTQATVTATGLCAGTYNVTVTDANGCSTPDSYVIGQPAIALSSSTSGNDATCFSGCDGDATVAASDGTPPYTYLWDDPGSQTNANATGLCAGTYNVTVTDANGCIITDSYIIGQPVSGLTLSTSGNDASCFGECDGSAMVTTFGGTAPYTYLWDDPDSQTTDNATGLCAGTYNVTVTDANNCPINDSYTINQPPLLTANITPSGPTTFCPGDSVILQSDPANTYDWLLNGSSTGLVSQSIVVSSGGDYEVVVTDTFGCDDTSAIVTVIVNSLPVIDTTFMAIDSSSCGNSDGSITGITASGTAPLTYQWTNSIATVVGGDSLNFIDMPADSYTLTIADGNGCIIVFSPFVIYDIGAPPAPAANDVTYCEGDPIADLTATGTGGTLTWYSDAALSDSIGTGSPFNSGATATDTFYVTETVIGCESPHDTVIITVNPLPPAPTASNDATYCQGDAIADLIAAGTTGILTWYSDAGLTNYIGIGSPFASGATATDSFYVTETISGCESPPDTVIITIIPLPPAPVTNDSTYCEGDSIADLTATGSGGTLTWYSDAALNDSIYTGSPFSSGAATDTTFYVTETVNGCEGPAGSVTILVNPYPIVNITSSQDTVCPGGDVTLTASGAGFYIWSTGDATATIVVNPNVDSYYSVTGTLNGCVSQPDTIFITVDTALNPVVTINLTSDTVICSGDEITISASGGDTYLWSTGDTVSSISVSPNSDTAYYVIAYTNNGCTSAADSVTINVAGGVLADFDAAPNQGNIPLTVSFTDESIGASQWEWDFGDDDGTSTDQDPSYIYNEQGQYEVTLIATDSNGCADTATLDIDAIEDTVLFIPTLFSPNEDGINDILYVRGSGIGWLELIIYNRWGESVFEGSKNEVWAEEGTYPADVGWDGTFNGKKMNPAVFVYILKGAYKDGVEFERTGNITLVK